MTTHVTWTKRDVKSMCSALAGFVLTHGSYGGDMERIRAAVAQHRQAIVVAGIMGLRNIIADRAEDNRKAAAHLESNPHVYGKDTPEMVSRFTRLAAEADASVATADKLLARIASSGLPPEVVAHDPFTR
jgi:hypothetical protein